MSNCKWHKDGTFDVGTWGWVFVFGSNLNGQHCGGAAKFAKEKLGATDGVSSGYTGGSYAIATLDTEFNKMPIEIIHSQVKELYQEASMQPVKFFITRIGCGIAGFKDEQIAPMFKGFEQLENVSLPENWKQYLETQENA